jgi:hypothetical protein
MSRLKVLLPKKRIMYKNAGFLSTIPFYTLVKTEYILQDQFQCRTK